jgi:hypothetical protein
MPKSSNKNAVDRLAELEQVLQDGMFDVASEAFARLDSLGNRDIIELLTATSNALDKVRRNRVQVPQVIQVEERQAEPHKKLGLERSMLNNLIGGIPNE